MEENHQIIAIAQNGQVIGRHTEGGVVSSSHTTDGWCEIDVTDQYGKHKYEGFYLVLIKVDPANSEE